MALTVAYRGNHQPGLPPGVAPWSTETHIAASLELLGHEVIRIQEDRESWSSTIAQCRRADAFLWTSTYGMAHRWDQREAWAAVERLNDALPTAAVHLDKFWGLGREQQVWTEPWFRLHHVFTADGDSDELWAKALVNHHWLPPAVYGPECIPGEPRPEFRAKVAFVGSWRSYGHPEWWPKRRALLDFLRETYGADFRCFPEGNEQIRGMRLNDLYASVDVVVGDSCLADTSRRYWSDRAFETVGRGGFLVHPYVEGMNDLLPEGYGVRYFNTADFADLRRAVDYYAYQATFRSMMRQTGMAHVRAHHTYAHRMQVVLDVLAEKKEAVG